MRTHKGVLLILKLPLMSKVSLYKGEDRFTNIAQSLSRLESQIKEGIKDKKRIVIKPDLTSAYKKGVSTNYKALEAVLSSLTRFTDKEITVAGSARIGKTKEAFSNLGYYNLKKSFELNFVDLYEEDDFESIEIYSRDLNPLKTKIPKIITESDFLVSISGLKTDDSVIASMGIKNMAGSLVERPLNHDGYKAINLSIANLMKVAAPDLSVIDAFEATEGEGPTRGDLITMKLALAGLDFLSVDTIGANLMGLNPYKIGYLSHCREESLGQGEISKIKVVGNTEVAKEKKKFRLHSKYEDQLNWE